MPRQQRQDSNFGGFVDTGFEDVDKVFRNNFEKGMEHGAMFAVYYKGKMVVDIWGGFQDKSHNHPWQRDTISMVMSVTKGVCAICLAVLADRGLLDYNEPVSTYWPEFAQNGKEDIMVKTLLSHQAGLPILKGGPKIDLEISQDHEIIGEILARQKSRWQPGSGFGYHSITMGWLMDQLIRRVDPKHRSSGQFFREEIAQPFDVDFFLGLPADQEHRVAQLVPAVKQGLARLFSRKSVWKMIPQALNPYSNFRRTMRGMGFLSKNDAPNQQNYHQAELPMNNGIGSARGLAKLYSILANGGMDSHTNQRLISESTCEYLRTPLCVGTDKIYHFFGGFSCGMLAYRENGRDIFGHPGLGGMAAFADVDKQLAWAYVPNKLVIYGSHDDDPRYIALRDTIFQCISKMEAASK